MDSDLISTLPDPILHHILGLLKTKQAVQTCVLSKRWERLWTSLSSLSLDYYDDFDPYLSFTKQEERDVRFGTSYERFTKFVHMVLLKREPLDLDVFRLFCKRAIRNQSLGLWYSDDAMEELFSAYAEDDALAVHTKEWIRYAVKHNTRVLDLSMLPDNSLPSFIFTCVSLEELYLQYCQISASGVVNLPNLRKLSVRLVDASDTFLPNILSGCTILESLHLESCFFSEYLISHESLKHLSVVDCKIFHDFRFLVNTPELLSFVYHGELPLSSPESLSMPSLVSADLEIINVLQTTLCEKLAPFLRAVSNVEHLKLGVQCPPCEEHPGITLPELRTCHKLKNFTIIFCTCFHFQMVTRILKSMPNLKKLTIMRMKLCYGGRRADASSMIEVPPCKNLEIVEVMYQGSDQLVGLLVDALVAGTKESENLKIVLSKLKG